jgi:AcrR family transcriptional regulator
MSPEVELSGHSVVAPPDGRPRPGLRERKKVKTRLAIQSHALRLFREHGYDATTVEEIIGVAEVSESTFYRYFPTKADVVLSDDLDPLFVAAISTQPAHLTALQAIRSAFGSVMAGLSTDQKVANRERLDLVFSVPELRAAILDQLADGIDLIAQAVADRTGRAVDDPVVRSLAGAVTGVGIAVMLAMAADPTADLAALLDESFAHLENGFTL